MPIPIIKKHSSTIRREVLLSPERSSGPGGPRSLSGRLFYVLVEPAEEFAVPDQRVLGLEDLMRLVFERHEPRRNAQRAGRREGFERLGVGRCV